MRRLMISLAMTALVATSTILGSPQVRAQNEPIKLGEHRFTQTATLVNVNRMGGIAVSGYLDCTQAWDDMQAAIQQDASERHADLTLEVRLSGSFVGPNFTATQYVGRSKVVTVTYSSGIARQCLVPGISPPYPWTTLYGYPVGQPQWLYSSTGKFAPGPIHIESEGAGVLLAQTFDAAHPELGPVDSYSMDLYSLSGWNLKAVR